MGARHWPCPHCIMDDQILKLLKPCQISLAAYFANREPYMAPKARVIGIVAPAFAIGTRLFLTDEITPDSRPYFLMSVSGTSMTSKDFVTDGNTYFSAASTWPQYVYNNAQGMTLHPHRSIPVIYDPHDRTRCVYFIDMDNIHSIHVLEVEAITAAIKEFSES